MSKTRTSLADLQILKKYYDSVRIVDPLAGTQLSTRVLQEEETTCQGDAKPCYHFYQQEGRCSNCVALQAIQLQDTFMKLELLNGSLVMVMAIPVQGAGGTAALELVKKVTNRTIEGLLSGTNNTDVRSALQKLSKLTFHDGLTHVYNRRYIDETLPMEMANAALGKRSFALVMADIDFFKRVNDQYGHGVGDEVIKTFAARLKSKIRSEGGDWLARYGGEEFVLFLSNCSQEQAYRVVEQIRRHVEETPIKADDIRIAVTASFGIYMFQGGEQDMQELLDGADKFLYQAKQQGRNCTMPRPRRNLAIVGRPCCHQEQAL